MTIIYSCAAAFVVAILILVLAMARTAKGSPEQQREDDAAQMAAMSEFRLGAEREHELFATK